MVMQNMLGKVYVKMVNGHVVVNFLSQVIFIFPLFQLR